MLNTSFSLKLPTLQLAVDSTSLGAYKTCPRYYFYNIVCGYQPRSESVHLTFGLLMHGSVERYHHSKAGGASHADSLDSALDWCLRSTWEKAVNRGWLSNDSYKNRYTLLRTLVGYLDKYGENDALQTIILDSGKPAVELSFSFDSGYSSRLTGEPFLFCGHLDRLATLNGVPYIPDVKTTKSELNARYWSGHNPSNQFGMYLLAGEIVYKLPVKGLIVDGAQVLVGDSRFDRHLITKDQFQMDEFYRSTGMWLRRMEDSAEEASQIQAPLLESIYASEQREATKEQLDYIEAAKAAAYPMNETSCSKYNGCDFQNICSRSPSARKQWLETGFKRRVWDPLQRRGDI